MKIDGFEELAILFSKSFKINWLTQISVLMFFGVLITLNLSSNKADKNSFVEDLP